MTKLKVNKTITLFLACTILITLGGIVYYLAVQVPAKKLAEIGLEKTRVASQMVQEKESKLDECLDECYQKYRDRWTRNCEIQGKKIDEKGRCPLPSELVKHLDEEYRHMREECLQRYK